MLKNKIIRGKGTGKEGNAEAKSKEASHCLPLCLSSSLPLCLINFLPFFPTLSIGLLKLPSQPVIN